jgi:hypothetical protein
MLRKPDRKTTAAKRTHVISKLSEKCHCGLKRGHHTPLQARKCTEEENSPGFKPPMIGKVMTPEEINRAEFKKI